MPPFTRFPIDVRRTTTAGSCTQWEIYDEYMKDLERQRQDEMTKAKGAKKAAGGPAQPAGAQATAQAGAAASAQPGAGGGTHREHSAGHGGPAMQSQGLSQSLHTVDRMVNQNMYEEIAMDFKYWDDASDAFRSASRQAGGRGREGRAGRGGQAGGWWH